MNRIEKHLKGSTQKKKYTIIPVSVSSDINHLHLLLHSYGRDFYRLQKRQLY